jgi:hypothetical protein
MSRYKTKLTTMRSGEFDVDLSIAVVAAIRIIVAYCPAADAGSDGEAEAGR